MTNRDRKTEALTVDKLEQEIVKVNYSTSAKPQSSSRAEIDSTKILKLAKKIRETYDYSDIALDGARQPS